MALIAEFEHMYPGMFMDGEIGWRKFWGLSSRIRSIRAKNRLDAMYVQMYRGVLASPEGDSRGANMLEDMYTESGRHVDPAFVETLREMLGEAAYNAEYYLESEQRFVDLLLNNPDAERLFPAETQDARDEWMGIV